MLSKTKNQTTSIVLPSGAPRTPQKSAPTPQRLFLKLSFLFAFTTAFTFFALKSPVKSNAASLENFSAGNIISDYVMENYTSMSVQDIQNFLSQKGNCNDTETYRASWYPNIHYHIQDGHFVCLADERFATSGSNYGDLLNPGEPSQSAAEIIYEVSQKYQINPQVLIVLLQKEQGLITDSWPNSIQYRSATGFGCPDTAACDSEYYGLKNQLESATHLFRSVLNGGWTNYPLGWNYIRYNPDAGCGGSDVYVENLATSALYRYTPYQPNQGALAAGYGTAHCGAYGNRNFYLYFQDYFGDPTQDTWPHLSVILSSNRVEKTDSELNLSYRANIQHYGWLDWVNGGEMSGTSGFSVPVEAIQLRLNNYPTGIEYRSYLSDKGWEEVYRSNGEESGATNNKTRLEAIQIRLSEELSNNYDVYYRTHVSGLGWLDWAKNDETSGVIGQSLQIEAFQVRLVRKNYTDTLGYSVHTCGLGWLNWVKDGELGGTTGEDRALEAIKILPPKALAASGDIVYHAHVSGLGWLNWVKDGELGGTTGEGRNLEALEIKLSGSLASNYDIIYRAYVSGLGWLDWVKNGELAGTTGQGRKIESLEIKLVAKPKEQTLNLSYSAHVAGLGWLNWVKDGELGGTTGEGRRVEGIKIKLVNENGEDVGLDSIRYRAHVSNIGWLNWVKDGELGGTTGEGRRVEGVEIELLNDAAIHYDIYYRAHVANLGWLDWVKNGELAGTTGRSLQVEAVEAKLVKK